MKNRLIKGTIILTTAGLITRLIGFGYRIFLSGTLGETKLGIYQLIFPVYSLAFTIYAAGIQTAVSQIISHEPEEKHAGIIKGGLFLSLFFAILLSLFLSGNADMVSVRFLGVADTAPLLRILAVVFPFCGVSSVINGYFYGINCAKIPAIAQIIEQLFRVGFVFALYFSHLMGPVTASAAVGGLLAGELSAHIFNCIQLVKKIPFTRIIKSRMQLKNVFSISLPLSSSKLVIALLGSIESVLIPVMLVRHGLAESSALAIYGILTGVVMPFIMFPGTLTNSLSVLLLPAISHASGKEQLARVRRTSRVACQYSLLLGVLTSCLFLAYGMDIGTYLFHSENAGKLLTISTFLCPFLYVSTTLGSIINGLGKTGTTFLNNIVGLGIRILFLLIVTPRHGIYGYLLGMLLSQIIICVLDASYLIRHIQLTLPLMKYLIWPYIFCVSILLLGKAVGYWLYAATGHSILNYAPLFPSGLCILFYLTGFKLIRWGDFFPKRTPDASYTSDTRI